tara:strand:- start:155 stop:499 length:345 start_codon:yes stop_codon:yes gene_type:complete
MLSIILLYLTFSFAQSSFTFTEDEVIDLYNTITELEYKDSTNFLVIKNLEDQLQLYIQQTKLDSSIIEDYKKQIEIQEEMIKTIKPKWYDNKYLWYTGGVLSMILPIWAVGQVQ